MTDVDKTKELISYRYKRNIILRAVICYARNFIR